MSNEMKEEIEKVVSVAKHSMLMINQLRDDIHKKEKVINYAIDVLLNIGTNNIPDNLSPDAYCVRAIQEMRDIHNGV